MREKVGLVGYGVMGSVIAARLKDEGYGVCIYDTQPAALARAKTVGHAIFENSDEVVEHCTVILLSLAKPTQVTDVVNRIVESSETHLSPGVIIVDTLSLIHI